MQNARSDLVYKMKSFPVFAFIWLTTLSLVLFSACISQKTTHRKEVVKYEAGSESVALEVERNLASALTKVEIGHQHGFKKDPVINIFATNQKFQQATGFTGNWVAGVSTPKGLFLAPQAPTHAIGVLEHELSHVLLRQWIGSYRFHKTPIWFREGLATWVADGGGARTVSVEQAELALVGGRAFTPNRVEGIFVRKGAQHWSLPHHMFYRQASLFIGFLARNHPEAWRNLLDYVHDGFSFSNAYAMSFDVEIEPLWQSFISSLD